MLRPFQPISVSPPWPLWSTSNWGIRCKLPSWAPANCLNVKRSMDWSNRGTSKMNAPTGFFIKTALSTELWSLGILKARHKFAHGVDSLSTPKAENGNRDDYFIWWHVRFLIPPSKQRQREDWTGILCLDLIQEISDKMCNTGTEMLSSKTTHLDALSKRWAKGIPHTATHQWWPEMFELWQPMLQRWDRWNPQPVQLWYELDYLSPRFHYIFRVQLPYANTLVVLINIHVHCSYTIIIHHTLYCIWQFIRV